MAYGFRAINDNNEVQIDGTYTNHLIVESGTYTQPAFSSGLSVADITFSNTYTYPPIIFTRQSYYLSLLSLKQSGSNYTGFRTISDTGSTGFSVDWYACVPSEAESLDAWGIKVWNASSEIVFDSGRNYMKIKDAVTFTTPSSSGASTTVNTVSGISNPYICLSSLQGRAFSFAGGFSIYFYVLAKRNTDSQWQMIINPVYTFTAIGNGTWLPVNQQLIIGSITA